MSDCVRAEQALNEEGWHNGWSRVSRAAEPLAGDYSVRELRPQGMSLGSPEMTLAEARETLEAEVIVGARLDEIELTMGCGADLMSDVLAFAKAGSLLLTGLTNVQVIRTAEMAEVVAICFVRGKRPPPQSVHLAASYDLPLIATRLPMFESCGRLYLRGLKGCSQSGD